MFKKLFRKDPFQLSESTEEFKALKAEWHAEARKQTLKTLPEFLNRLVEDYGHDYGTICHALAAGAIGAAWALEHTPQGGITGFQAGAVMWEFIRGWNHSSNKCGMRIIDYDDMLFPQYEEKFTKLTLSKSIWNALRKEAQRHIAEADEKMRQYDKDLSVYGQAMIKFVDKFPDYWERPEYYKRLGMGNMVEWEAERRKEESGFEFAPDQPYRPIDPSSNVYRHWVSIANGTPPFGYVVGED